MSVHTCSPIKQGNERESSRREARTSDQPRTMILIMRLILALALEIFRCSFEFELELGFGFGSRFSTMVRVDAFLLYRGPFHRFVIIRSHSFCIGVIGVSLSPVHGRRQDVGRRRQEAALEMRGFIYTYRVIQSIHVGDMMLLSLCSLQDLSSP